MKYPPVLKSLAAVVLCTTAALAQDQPADMQRVFGEICADRQARVAGSLAYLEVTLSLTDKQQPLFERWRKIKFASIKEADCTPPSTEPSIIDSMKHEEKMLRTRLAELKAETPALEALIAVLTPEQKKAFRPQGHPPLPPPDRAPHHEAGEPGDAPEF